MLTRSLPSFSKNLYHSSYEYYKRVGRLNGLYILCTVTVSSLLRNVNKIMKWFIFYYYNNINFLTCSRVKLLSREDMNVFVKGFLV